MIVINEDALKECREIGYCEYCGAPGTLHAHHLLSRGAGGGTRLDLPINLICLCEGCHREAHNSLIRFDRLAGIVIRRELWKIQRMPKGSDIEAIRREVQG